MISKPRIAVGFAAAAAALAFAASASDTAVSITRPVVAGDTTLPPGEYRIGWIASGSGTMIRLSCGNRLVATVPATLKLRRQTSGASLLLTIDWGMLTAAVAA